MAKVAKPTALAILGNLIERGRVFASKSYAPKEFDVWRREAEEAARQLFDGEEPPEFDDRAFIAQELLDDGATDLYRDYDPEYAMQSLRQSFTTGMEAAMAKLEAMTSKVRTYWSDEPEATASPVALSRRVAGVDTVLRICERFPDVVRQLSKRRKGRRPLAMVDEYDVQYLLGGLLSAEFDDVRPEEWTPSYAGAASRIDFVLPTHHIAVEVKMTREGLEAKEVGEQLLVDRGRYNARIGLETLVCLVHDPAGRIINPRGLERDLEASDGRLAVRVRIR